MDVPEIEKMAPATGPQSAPSSGAYGEKADLAALQASFPKADQQPKPDMAAVMPTVAPPQSAPPPPPGTLPPGLTAPSRHPDMPTSQPLSASGQQFVGNPREQRIQLLHALTVSNSVSADTKEWASTVLKWLIRTPQA